MPLLGRRLPAAVLAGVVLLTGCSGTDDAGAGAPPGSDGPAPPGSAPSSRTPSGQSPSATPSGPTGSTGPTRPVRPSAAPPSATATPPQVDLPFGGRRVLAISIDGLAPQALRTLGREGAPAIWSLIDNGAATLDARTEVEATKTLPNHVGMITGRPIGTDRGGHGVDWNNNQRGRSVQSAAGGPVESIFTVVHRAGGTTGIFAGKAKFGVFETSWPEAIDTSIIAPRLPVLADAVARDLRVERRTFTFVHVAEPDEVGHTRGWGSPDYLTSVREADALVARLLDIVQRSSELARGMVVVLTADHGGQGKQHDDETDPANHTIPFVVAGAGVEQGDLYALSPELVVPGRGRPTHADGAARNCDLANVSAAVLGLDPVPGSSCDGAASMPVTGP